MKKFNKTAYTALLCLKFMLANRTFSIVEVLEYLEEKENIFLEKETILKYIRTFKALGFCIEKENVQIYKLTSSPFRFDNQVENSLFKILSITNDYIASNNSQLKIFIDKLNILLHTKIKNKISKLEFYNDKSVNSTISKMQKYCADKRQIKITYITNDTMNTSYVEPIEVIKKDEIYYLQCINIRDKSITSIAIEDIIKVISTPLKNKSYINKQYVTLQILSKFAQTYTHQDSDEILESNQNFLIIRREYNDKITLFKSLLRYMGNCKIISPIAVRKGFQDYAEQLYQLYDCPK